MLPGTFHGGGWLNTESTVPFLHDLLSDVRRGMTESQGNSLFVSPRTPSIDFTVLK